MTPEKLDTRSVELISELANFVPPTEVIDKPVYGP